MTDEDYKKYISTCPKCEEWYPTVIHTCMECNTECATSRGYTHINAFNHSVFKCLECHNKMVNKYQNLLAFAGKVSNASRYELEEYGFKFTQEAEELCK